MLAAPTSKNFATSLRDARKAKGWTQDQLAEKADISKVMPGRYERGVSKPELSTWLKLNAAFFPDVEVGELNAVVEEIETEPEVLDIKEATVEQLIQELKSRGFSSVSLAS